MRNIIILCIMLLSNIWGFSQNFQITDNLIMEKIAEIEFRNAYQSKRQSIFKWKPEKEYPKIVRHFLDSDIGRRNYIFDGQDLIILKLNPESYILKETVEVLSNAYYINGNTPDTTAMFGLGDVDNEQIYYASPDYDCDQHLWCRWYSFIDGKVSILAEIEDKTFEYDLAIFYDLPSFFADNRGYYYIVVQKNPNIYHNVDEKIFYKISLK